MTSLPQPLVRVRSPRVRLPETTPVVLRFSNGHRAPVELSLVSLTGGLLRVQKPVAHGARVSMMFLTHTGPVIGQAELLNPVSWTEQPFRFLALQADDQRRLRAAIQGSTPTAASASAPVSTSTAAPASALPPAAPCAPTMVITTAGEQDWIEKYRAAMDAPAPRSKVRAVIAALALATIGVAGFVYFLSPHLLK